MAVIISRIIDAEGLGNFRGVGIEQDDDGCVILLWDLLLLSLHLCVLASGVMEINLGTLFIREERIFLKLSNSAASSGEDIPVFLLTNPKAAEAHV